MKHQNIPLSLFVSLAVAMHEVNKTKQNNDIYMVMDSCILPAEAYWSWSLFVSETVRKH